MCTAPAGQLTYFARPSRPGWHNRGIEISTRRIFAAALLVTSALTLTACGPNDKKDDKSSGSSAASQPATDKGDRGDKNDKADKGKGGDKKGDCPTIAKGHKVIKVGGVEGAMNNVVAQNAKMVCDPAMHQGATYHPEGGFKTYHWKSGSKVTIIGKNGPEDRSAQTDDDKLTGIGHVKECADPDHQGYDSGQTKADHKEYCYGQNFYDVAVGSDDTITEMTELYGS